MSLGRTTRFVPCRRFPRVSGDEPVARVLVALVLVVFPA